MRSLFLVPLDELDEVEALIIDAINDAMAAPFDDNDRCRQRVLFSGLDCLPGQQDLFPTDGGNHVPHRDDQDPSS